MATSEKAICLSLLSFCCCLFEWYEVDRHRSLSLCLVPLCRHAGCHEACQQSGDGSASQCRHYYGLLLVSIGLVP